jgi:hypothetical protein
MPSEGVLVLNKNVPLWTLAVAVGLLILCVVRQSSGSDRFQLRTEEYEQISSAAVTTNKNLFKIDTKTGETWEYVNILDTKNQTTIRRWEHVSQ